MPRKSAPKQRTSVAISEEARELLALMADKASISPAAVLELAIRERAERENVTLTNGPAPALEVDAREAARQQFRELLAEAHRNATCDLAPEELDREVTLAHEEAREILRALLQQAHRNVPADVTPEELEREVTLADEEARLVYHRISR